MTSPFRRRENDLPCNLTMNRRDMMLAAGTGLAFAGTGPLAPVTSARQGHSPSLATPGGSDTPTLANDSPLTKLLSMVPYSLVMNSPGWPYWSYCDFARQYAALGMDRDGSPPDLSDIPIPMATIALRPGSEAYSHSLFETFTGSIGFNPLLMNQHLMIGDPPEQISMFKGDFSPRALVAAWKATGYRPVETASGIEAWSIGPDGQFKVDHLVQRLVLSEMNNVAIVEDVLIYANTLDLLNVVLNHIVGGGATSIDDEVWGPVIQSLPETVVSALAVTPVLDWSEPNLDTERMDAIQADMDAVRESVGPMPDATAMIVAVEEGAVHIDFEWEGLPAPVDAGTMFVRLGTQSAEDAEQVARVVVARSESLSSLVSGEPYSELIVAEREGSEGTTAAIDFTQLESPRVWSNMVLMRDVLLFVPDSSL